MKMFPVEILHQVTMRWPTLRSTRWLTVSQKSTDPSATIFPHRARVRESQLYPQAYIRYPSPLGRSIMCSNTMDWRSQGLTNADIVSFTAIICVVTQCFSPLTAAHIRTTFLSFCFDCSSEFKWNWHCDRPRFRNECGSDVNNRSWGEALRDDTNNGCEGN